MTKTEPCLKLFTQAVHSTLQCVELRNAPYPLYEKLRSVVCNNWLDSADYKAKQGVHPFLQCWDVTEGRSFNYAMVEFWCKDEALVEAYVAYLNQRLGEKDDDA